MGLKTDMKPYTGTEIYLGAVDSFRNKNALKNPTVFLRQIICNIIAKKDIAYHVCVYLGNAGMIAKYEICFRILTWIARYCARLVLVHDDKRGKDRLPDVIIPTPFLIAKGIAGKGDKNQQGNSYSLHNLIIALFQENSRALAFNF